MLMDALTMLGVPEKLVESWKQKTGTELLPVQERAIRQFGLLTGGRNLVILAPTSSGKTQVAELAAAKAALENRKTIFLEPQVALVDEKFHHMQETYGPLGIKVVVSSRDHREFDTAISRGEFGIAVVVFEKLQSLLVTRPQLLHEVALVVIDELQVLADEERGPDLELLLTKIRSSKATPRLLGLSAVIGRGQRLAEWLDADLLVEERRPVELRKGVLYRGKFDYREHNTGERGEEEFTDIQSDSYEDLCCALVEDLVLKHKEQALWFVKDRKTCVTLAALVADRVSSRFPAATEAIEELRDLDDTYAKAVLLRLLESGIAFHNSDLSIQERRLVERHFRNGNIKVVFATQTLAVGVNLPAENVIVPDRKWCLAGPKRDWTTGAVSRAEYENMSGRAGRLPAPGAPVPKFGRSIVVTASEFMVEVVHRNYIDRPLEEIAPSLQNAPLEKHVLSLIASGFAQSFDAIRDLLVASFTGQVYWRAAREVFVGQLGKAIQSLTTNDLVEENAGALRTTDLGRVCAAKGLEIATAVGFANWAKEASAAALTDIEILSVLSFTRDAEKMRIADPTSEDYKASYTKEVLRRAETAGERPVFRKIRQDPMAVQWEDTFAFKRAMLLQDWINEAELRDLECLYGMWSGAIARTALEFAWLADGLTGVVGALNWPAERCAHLDRLAMRITMGLKEDALGLASIRREGVGRATVRRLANAGIRSVDELLSKDENALKEILGSARAAKSLLAKVKGRPAKVVELIPLSPVLDLPEPRGTPVAPAQRAAEAEPLYAEPVLTIDDVQHRLFYKSFEVPTRAKPGKKTAASKGKRTRQRPSHMQPQMYRAMLILARHYPAIVSMAQMAQELFDMGSLRDPDTTPEQRLLHHRITGSLKKVLVPLGVPKTEIDELIVAQPGVGLRLAVPVKLIEPERPRQTACGA